MKNKVVLSLCMALLGFGLSFAQSDAPQVKTGDGIVEGVYDSGLRVFKGVPFATPPVGDLRWKEPRPVQPWTGIREAKKFGPRPMQLPVFGDMNFRSAEISEDCLYLNIWTPATSASDKLPVLVYYYGGGFIAGDGSEFRYDGESMARHGIVAVTVNYRLGVFGFLSHPELTKESPHRASGNYGLLDQAAALAWVKRNVTAFGGDPEKITIAGESAGSISVSALMASPLSKGLIAAAIGESGSVLGAFSAVPLSEGEKAGLQFATKCGASSISELRAMPAADLLKISDRFAITVDGYFFPEDPMTVYKNGKQAHVPLLVGWNSQEMAGAALMGSLPLTVDNFNSQVQKLYGDKAADILKVYHPATDAEVEEVAIALAGDRFIAFSTWKWSDLQAQTGRSAVYRYFYERPRPEMRPEMGDAVAGLAGGVIKNSGAKKMPAAKGAVHSAEIEYALGNLPTNRVYDWQYQDYKVSGILQDYFLHFIKTGNPNGLGLPQWSAVQRNVPAQVMHINVETRLETESVRDRYLTLDK